MIVLATATAIIAPAQTSGLHVDVPTMPLASALRRLAAQADVDLAIRAPLGGREGDPLRGEMTTEEAFRRLLTPHRLRAVRLADRAYRIEALSEPPRPTPAPFYQPLVTTDILSDVVVLGRRQPLSLGERETSTSTIIAEQILNSSSGSTETLSNLSAAVESTRQGLGRNKLFVRGIADSAFTGALQSTVAQYLGPYRLSYGTPDPDYALIDVRSIRVSEGPQGARFGSGALGGAVRIIPQPPDLAARKMTATLGLSTTSGGEPGGDAALVLNTPIGTDTAARLVVYGQEEGGVVDAPLRGKTDVDDVRQAGARLSVRHQIANWTFDLTATGQAIEGDDTQSGTRRSSGLTKPDADGEPYHLRAALLGVDIHGEEGRWTVASTTGTSLLGVEEVFDASRAVSGDTVSVFRRRSGGTLSHETAVARTFGPLTINLGASVILHRFEDRTNRTSEAREAQKILRRRSVTEGGPFLEARWDATERLRIDVNVRYVASGLTDTVITQAATPARARILKDNHWLHTVQGTLQVSPRTTLFLRHANGIRTGGVIAYDQDLLDVLRPDRLDMSEAGIRYDDGGPIRVELSAGHSRWRDVQADQIDESGDLFTRNIGEGRMRFIQIKAGWQITPHMIVESSLFANANALKIAEAIRQDCGQCRLPNVAPLGSQAQIRYDLGTWVNRQVRLVANARYIGPSRVGIGAALDRPQGNYVNADITVRWGDERGAVIVGVRNLFDARGARFGLGSPYRLDNPTTVPVRPVTARLALERTF